MYRISRSIILSITGFSGPRLVKIANSENFHLVVMGTRGLGAARSIMLGSACDGRQVGKFFSLY